MVYDNVTVPQFPASNLYTKEVFLAGVSMYGLLYVTVTLSTRDMQGHLWCVLHIASKYSQGLTHFWLVVGKDISVYCLLYVPQNIPRDLPSSWPPLAGYMVSI